jgi:hypothetical protein
MSEKDNLQEADGTKEQDLQKETTSTPEVEKETITPVEPDTVEISEEIETKEEVSNEFSDNTVTETEVIETVAEEATKEEPVKVKEKLPKEAKAKGEKKEIEEKHIDEIHDSNAEEIEDVDNTITDSEVLENIAEETPKEEPVKVKEKLPKKAEAESKKKEIEEKHIEEIHDSNAEEAEDANNSKRHEIEEKDYHAMSMDELIVELEELLSHDSVQNVRNQVETIKSEFSAKFSHVLEEAKQEFLDGGGNSIDFKFSFPLKTKFNELYRNYRDRKQSYYKNLEKSLKENLENRLEIIDEIKHLLNVEENINDTYKHFKALQDRWRNAGPIPRDKYNNVWNNYHHHVENFYDFLHLNRDLRDLDFKHNLEQKLKIVERAEELAQDDNSNRAFRELQVLHKIWKEELGPVAREFRDVIWDKFSAATKTIHEKRQVYFSRLDEVYEENLVKKNEIIENIKAIAEDKTNNHSVWQKKIKQIEDLRQQFFKAGKVPLKVNEATWAKFKEVVRIFNRNKNAFYKSLKKDQFSNLENKLELIKIAEENKDSDDFEVTTPLMKKIQNDWKKIGHVPRKDSDKIWKQFKAACNHYFDKLHAQKNEENKEEVEAFNKKTEFIEKLKNFEIDKDDVKASLKLIKKQTTAWKEIGRVPFNNRFIEKKFHKIIDALYNKLDMNKGETELLKYDSKLETMANASDNRSLTNEHNFIRKKIDELKAEINQLENNLLFFSNVDKTNPVVKDVYKNIDKHKNELSIWKAKLKKVKKIY